MECIEIFGAKCYCQLHSSYQMSIKCSLGYVFINILHLVTYDVNV